MKFRYPHSPLHRKTPIFYQYFFRYFRIVMIPLLAGILVYALILQYSGSSARTNFLNGANEIASRVEKTLSDINQISSMLLTDTYLVSLSRLSDIPLYSLEHTQRLQQLQKKISTMQSTNGSITSIQILFHESQFYMTEGVSYKFTAQASDLYLTRQMGEEVFQAFTGKQIGTQFFFPSSIEGTNQSAFYYLRTATTSTGDLVSILFELDKSIFRGQMVSETLSSFLYHGSNYIYSDNCIAQSIESFPDPQEVSHGIPFAWESKYQGILIASSIPDLYTLLAVIPTSAYHSSLLYLNLIGILYLLLCLAVGSFISYLMAKKSATPIANMLASLGMASLDENYKDDLKLIEESLKELQNNNRQYRIRMNHYQTYLTNDCLVRLLKQRSYSNPIDIQQYQHFMEKIHSCNYLLLGFNLEDASDLFFDTGNHPETDMAGQMQDMIFFVLQNVGSELLSQHFKTFFGDVDNHLICLLCSDQKTSDIHLALQNDLSSLVYFLKNKFNVSIAVCVSDIISNTTQIPETWTQIQDMIHYRNLIGSSSYILHHKDISSEDFAGSDVILPIIQSLYRQDYAEALIKLQSISPTGQKKAILQKSELSQDVQEYIQNNFTDHNLSAGQIADHFHMSLSNLSQLYKRDTGRGILDDIHYCRIQRAKELLADNCTIQNAAQLSGYYNTRPMVEAFKRIEGMTPSEYKRKQSTTDK